MRARTATAALLAALALPACSAETDGAGGDSSSPLQNLGADPGVAHVHGLGVDPADDTLYAATHFGLFALPEDGTATRVADRFQDTMGFTITGPSTFLGSGHPDFRKDPQLPPRLGLIRSTDAAQTWQTVSLTGEVDFHVLHSAHGSIYGWDASSGRLMVSGDEGETWETRSTLDLRDFVVSPTDPDVLFATTDQGLVQSRDRGRTFSTVVDAPSLVVLTWHQPDDLYGVDLSGTVRVSADRGGTWDTLGTVGGEPEALAAHAEDLYAAVSGGGIQSSSDGGRNWTVRYREVGD